MIFLQESHSVSAIENKWCQEWGYKIIFSHVRSDSAGVCMLFKPSANFDILSTHTDSNGRILLVIVKINDSPVTLVNIYGPNSDDGIFFSELHELLCNYGEEPYILGGDFNIILNPNLDNFPRLIQNHLNCYNATQNIISGFELVDVWRHLHPAALKYTWISHDCKSGSRLDYFLISQSLIQSAKKSEITFGYRSDHSFASLHLTKSVIKRGPGFWKLNTTLLADADVADSIRDEIKIVLTENAGSSFSKIWEFYEIQSSL